MVVNFSNRVCRFRKSFEEFFFKRKPLQSKSYDSPIPACTQVKDTPHEFITHLEQDVLKVKETEDLHLTERELQECVVD